MCKVCTGSEGVRLLFRLRTGSAWLLEDMERCKIIRDEMYVMCDSGAGKNVSIHW